MFFLYIQLLKQFIFLLVLEKVNIIFSWIMYCLVIIIINNLHLGIPLYLPHIIKMYIGN